MIDETRAIFGVAGFPPAFFESTYRKKRENIFEWLNKIGLDWVELQNTYGVKMKDAQAYLYKQLAQEYGIGISLHAVKSAIRLGERKQRSCIFHGCGSIWQRKRGDFAGSL